MSDQKETTLDKGCVVGIAAAAIFFIVPIIAWWMPLIMKVISLIGRLIGIQP